jgi:hypothetical protein
LTDSFRYGVSLRGSRNCSQDDKFIAAEAGAQIAVTCLSTNRFGNDLSTLSPARVPEMSLMALK